MSDKPSWRDFWKVHPAAEAFPLMDAEELRKLADDIDANGLKVPAERRLTKSGVYVIDGRNRLDALESKGVQLVNDKGGWLHPEYVHSPGREYTDAEIANEVIALNARRRHQSKYELADCIVRALAAVSTDKSTDVVKITKSVKRAESGRLTGSEKGIRGQAVEIAKQHGISASTVDKVLAKQKPGASAPAKRIRLKRLPPGIPKKERLELRIAELSETEGDLVEMTHAMFYWGSLSDDERDRFIRKAKSGVNVWKHTAHQ